MVGEYSKKAGQQKSQLSVEQPDYDECKKKKKVTERIYMIKEQNISGCSGITRAKGVIITAKKEGRLGAGSSE